MWQSKQSPYLCFHPSLDKEEDVGSSNSEIGDSLIPVELYLHTISSSHWAKNWEVDVWELICCVATLQ